MKKTMAKVETGTLGGSLPKYMNQQQQAHIDAWELGGAEAND